MAICKTIRASGFFLLVTLWVLTYPFWSKHAIAAISANRSIGRFSTSLAPDVNLAECRDLCLWKTGINGSWIQDFDFARDYGQYPKPWVIPEGPFQRKTAGAFQPSKDAPFPWRTSWKWVDHETDCQVDILTIDKFCTVLRELKVDRILFFGDSLTESMYNSLANMVGRDHFRLSPDNKRNATMICPPENRDDLGATDRTVPVFHKKVTVEKVPPSQMRKKIELDHDVLHYFAKSNDRVLGIFNIGAHYHDFNLYREDLDALLNLLSAIKRPQDLYFFRATSPGHEGCRPRTRKFDWRVGTRLVPLGKFEDYKATVGHRHGWDKFEAYNHYTEQLLLKRNQKGLDDLIFHYLDIWNMTVLRNDAHAAPSDCLHFQAPGPVDWWNHFLFTYLSRLSRHQESTLSTNATSLSNCRRSFSKHNGRLKTQTGRKVYNSTY